jgi:hypothetical protein
MYSDDGNKGKGLLGAGLSSAKLAQDGLSSALRSKDFFSRRKVEGLWFETKKLVLDGYSFNGCRFDNCTLVVSSTNFDLTNCLIDERCVIEYGNEITKIIQLFNSQWEQAYHRWASPFVPKKNPNGSITITLGKV